MRHKRLRAIAVLLTAMMLPVTMASAAGPEDFKAALRSTSAELGWSKDEVSILDGPVSINDDAGNLTYRGHSYEAILGYTITMKIVENLDPSISADNLPYVEHLLRGQTGGITEKMSNPFAGMVESWRSMQLTRRADDIDKTTWIFNFGVTDAYVVSVYWSYGTHLTPDPNKVLEYIEVLAKHANLLPKTYIHGELRIAADPCKDAKGNPRHVAVIITMKGGGERWLRASDETTIRINDISRIRVEGECGVTIYREDGSRHRIEPGFDQAGIVTFRERIDRAGALILKLFNGVGRFVIPPSKSPTPGSDMRFKVETNVAHNGVHGTDFTVSHDARIDRSVIGVVEGEILVTPYISGAESFILNAGQQVDITPARVGAIVPYKIASRIEEPPTGRPVTETNFDLTGYWLDDNPDFSSCYHIRQVGDELFWRLESVPHVINVFYGVIAGNTVNGEWADMPGGRLQNSGTVSLRIESTARMVKIGQSEHYGGNVWQRVASCGTP